MLKVPCLLDWVKGPTFGLSSTAVSSILNCSLKYLSYHSLFRYLCGSDTVYCIYIFPSVCSPYICISYYVSSKRAKCKMTLSNDSHSLGNINQNTLKENIITGLFNLIHFDNIFSLFLSSLLREDPTLLL